MRIFSHNKVTNLLFLGFLILCIVVALAMKVHVITVVPEQKKEQGLFPFALDSMAKIMEEDRK